jgi:hypothetical protein
MTTSTMSALLNRHFLVHFLEMVAAMLVGMYALGWLWPDLPGGVVLMAVVMATDMTIGMAAWMAVRGHSRMGIAEMSAAMYAPFVVVLVPYWAGVLPVGLVFPLGHLLMLPAMVVAMLHRRDEYTGAAHVHDVRDTEPSAGRSEIVNGAVSLRY